METVLPEPERRCARIARLTVVLFAVAMATPASRVLAAPSHHAPPAHAPAHPASRPASTGSGGWSAANCGREPVAPTVQTDTVPHYNASIDAVTAYDQAARTYNACVSRTATAEQTAISADAKRRIDAIQAVSESVQRRIAANFTALGAALKKAPPSR